MTNEITESVEYRRGYDDALRLAAAFRQNDVDKIQLPLGITTVAVVTGQRREFEADSWTAYVHRDTVTLVAWKKAHKEGS
jgi:hypothetical protein